MTRPQVVLLTIAGVSLLGAVSVWALRHLRPPMTVEDPVVTMARKELVEIAWGIDNLGPVRWEFGLGSLHQRIQRHLEAHGLMLEPTLARSGEQVLDYWGQPVLLFVDEPTPGTSVVIAVASRGPNGVWDGNSGDDLVIAVPPKAAAPPIAR